MNKGSFRCLSYTKSEAGQGLLAAWEADVLPLNYARTFKRAKGFSPGATVAARAFVHAFVQSGGGWTHDKPN